ncbi:STAS/SEC14 domain-containing protein [Synoicihabitans lomoniglobus]|uniref:STAS/SEC14 domain-containing protein n=1 Tax=Synoicihabitans lomoniglobus TaxID=2909285 RepID=A0AAF0CSJ1_9BACT|nr:STAS/SEC14 domain-containing protein [Opitutaceae bacterium LMO-M01]WED67255.1 STAS/SEC14 domain-containing protein [Opitutaceae bacterium LMO-M01]
MIDQLPASAHDTLVVQASGILNAADYERDFIPAMERLMRIHGKISVVLYLDEQFDGWDLEAMWDDARFGLKHRHDFNRLAVVGAQIWFKWAIQLGSHFIDGELRTFPGNQLEEAIAWAKAGALSESLETAAK